MERQEASIVGQGAMVKDILIMIKVKKQTWAGHFMLCICNKWTTEVVVTTQEFWMSRQTGPGGKIKLEHVPDQVGVQ